MLAAAMLVAIARNHPFEQGNKRTAVEAAGYFLVLNGYAWQAPDVDDGSEDDFAEHLLTILDRQMTVEQFANRFSRYIVPL